MSLPARVRRAPIAIVSVLAVLAAGLVAAAPAQAVPGAGSPIFINEIHYDNVGTDTGEAIEVAAPAGTDLSAWSIVRYNGTAPAAAVTYATPAATNGLGVATDSGNGWGLVVVNYAVDGLQNGTNDGFALVNGAGSVVQLLSYEGVFTAANGPAAGMTSTDIGVTEGTATAIGSSLQLTGGPGNDPGDFTWGAASASTFGQANTGQTFISVGDSAPAVASTNPAHNATDVPVNSNVTVTFSEPVSVKAASFHLTCANSGAHAVSVNDGTTTYTLDPTTDFGVNEMCTLTVVAAEVHDVDGDDPPDTMTADHTVSFRTVPPAPSCDDTDTKISAVQGPGATSPLVNTNVTVEAVVTAIKPGLSGFFIQEEVADQDASDLTSEGIFIRTGSATPPAGIEVGDVVQVTGGVREFTSTTGVGSSQTQISAGVTFLDCGPAVAGVPAAGVLEFPVAQFTDFEHFEGMRVTMPQPLVISEYFNFGRFNETVVGVPPNGRARFDSPTAVQEPSVAATAATLADYAKRRITLDDARGTQNTTPPYFPGTVNTPFTLTNTFRGGDTLTDVTGVMEHTFGLYRVHPTTDATYTSVNARPEAPPAVGGDTKIASFNVLNYFLSLDNGTANCGPASNLGCRGANDENERQRQRAKIIAAMVKIDADIFGLMEMENTTGVEPAADLAAGLNDATAPGTYSYIDTGVIGTDAIRVGILYKPAKVTPVGAFKVLDSSVDPRFNDTRNRPTLAQTFQRAGSGERITIAVNHLKSKGSACGATDPDTGDGAGNCNITRTEAAKALSDWLATDPTHSGDPDRLIIGDLNSYDHEDPIDALVAGGYTDLVKKYGGEFAYSYVFDGQVGYLDHGLASQSLVPQVTGAADWHINADEPTILDYDTTFKHDPEDALYEPKAYRASDHDAVIVGMELGVRQCQFSDNVATSTRTLQADCDTSRTILVPDGWTLDGAGHSITAKDPADGHFLGAVVRNAGTRANVRNLTVTADSLNDVCDGGDNRLRGILFDGASGSILNNHVLGIKQGASGCQEGNGIEVRNAPFDTTGVDKAVLISGNEVRDYQKGGIVANGSVNVSVIGNTVVGAGPIAYIAQNGVQLAFGATGLVESNTMSNNFYTGPDLGCGLLFFEADGVKQKKNTFAGNEKDICNFGRGGGSPAK